MLYPLLAILRFALADLFDVVWPALAAAALDAHVALRSAETAAWYWYLDWASSSQGIILSIALVVLVTFLLEIWVPELARRHDDSSQR